MLVLGLGLVVWVLSYSGFWGGGGRSSGSSRV